jgi:hypothetical protein
MTDEERMDLAEKLFMAVDFQWGDPPQPVMVLALPRGADVSASLRDTLDRCKGRPA